MNADRRISIKKFTHPFIWIMILISGLLINANKLVFGINNNLYKISAIKAYLSIDLSKLRYNDALQDSIPDGWQVEAWGGAREKYDISSMSSYSGKRSVVVEHTNDQGAATLMQEFVVVPESNIQVRVHSKGDSGAIQLQFWDKTKGTWSGGAWKEISSSVQWQETILDSNVPFDADRARVLLYAVAGKTFFDDSYVGMMNAGILGPNLLTNADFEVDGISENPLEWWEQFVSYRKPFKLQTEQSHNIGFLNMIDLVEGNFTNIYSRAQELDNRCVFLPEATSFLLSYGSQFRLIGGATAEERLYQLAQALAPNCPRPYAELANLYKSSKSFWKASNLYAKAADLSVGTVLEGKYAFEAGLIEWMYTGELDKALIHLGRAESINGWETSQWELGAATYYLARTLEDMGRKDEAVQAYLRLINCEKCVNHRSNAKLQLDKIQ